MKWLGTVLLIVLLTGCSTTRGYPERAQPISEDLAAFKEYITPEKVKEYSSLGKELKYRIALRNEIILARLYIIDAYYTEFVASLTSENAAAGVASDWVSLTLSGLGATVGGPETKAALAAAAAGVMGAKSSFDKRIFVEKTVDAIVAGMDARRQTVAVRIQKGLSQSIEAYPLAQGLSDVEDYYRSGSLMGGLMALSEQANAEKAKQDVELNQVLSARYGEDSLSDVLSTCIGFDEQAGAFNNAAKLGALRAWITKELPPPQPPVALLLTAEEYKHWRPAAVIAVCPEFIPQNRK